MRGDPNFPSEISKVEFPELLDRTPGERVVARNLDLIRDVQVGASAILGTATVSAGRLFDLREGEVLELDQDISQPVEIRVEGKLVGRGEIVVVGDRFGILITQLAAQ